MSFASDKLYNGYLRRNLPTIASKVKVREIIVHLPCLTDHDTENIEAKREMNGNHDGMVLLLDCLKRRENWPEQFIEALEACQHRILAAEIRAEYNALKGVSNSSLGSPPTTVTRVHVHPAPVASHQLIPESGGAKSPAAVAPPADAPPASPEQAAQAPPAPKTASGQVHEVVSLPELVAEPPQSAQIEVPPLPSTPPPSPEIPRAQVIDVPLRQEELNSHQEPETDVQDVSGDTRLIPDEANSGASSLQQHAATLADALSSAGSLQMAVVGDRQPQSPVQINSDATDGSFLTMTPQKHPVQDTAPPVSKTSNAVLHPEKTLQPPAPKIVESIPKTGPAAAAEPPVDEITTSLDDVYLSKPGQLISVPPQHPASPAAQASSQIQAPYSGNTERLEMSEAAADTGISTYSPKCSHSVTGFPCQENGVAPDHNEPEENHYESPNESMVREFVGHISEEPSILNLDGQTTEPQVPLINGETGKEVTSGPPGSVNTGDPLSLTSQSCNAAEPAPAGASPDLKCLQNSEGNTATETHFIPSSNTKYLLTAAGVCAFALLLAWRFKK